MYSRYAETAGWKVDILNDSESQTGGYKEVIASVSGAAVYSKLRFEGGVHRVQRVPATETQGRIHTSTATVAVLPEAEEVDVQIDDKDLKIDIAASGGPGGQGVNTTNSAVQITHVPTGMIVKCQDERSQLKNKAKALKILRARLLDIERERQDAAISAERRTMVATGERSQKIRTYNFPQNRITDHRIGLTLYKLDRVVEGDLDELIGQLRTHRQAELLFAGGLGAAPARTVGGGFRRMTAPGDVDRGALLCALVLAPTTFARNRFYSLFTEPSARRTRSRAAQLRTIVRHFAHDNPRAELARASGPRGRHISFAVRDTPPQSPANLGSRSARAGARSFCHRAPRAPGLGAAASRDRGQFRRPRRS